MAWTVGKVYSETELEAIAKERLNEDSKRREADIRSIKEWMSKQPHLKENGRKGLLGILEYHRGALKNYVDKMRWVGGSSNVNVTNKAYLVKMSTGGR